MTPHQKSAAPVPSARSMNSPQACRVMGPTPTTRGSTVASSTDQCGCLQTKPIQHTVNWASRATHRLAATEQNNQRLEPAWAWSFCRTHAGIARCVTLRTRGCYELGRLEG